jgi:hypothetical protein
MKKIKPETLVLTTRECGPKDAPIRADKYGTVIRVEGDRYLVFFGSTPEDIREVWLDADDIKRLPTYSEIQAQKKK